MADHTLVAPTSSGEISDDGNWEGADKGGGLFVWEVREATQESSTELLLSSYTDMTEALANTPIVVVDSSATLNNFTLPADATLIGNGGILTLSGVATILGSVISEAQVFATDPTDLHKWGATQSCNMRLFGATPSGDNTSGGPAGANRTAFLSAWTMSRGNGAAVSGAAMEITGGWYPMDPIDISTDAPDDHGDNPLIMRAAKLVLPDGADTTLLNISGHGNGALKETFISGLKIIGNKANNTFAADTPIMRVTSYSCKLVDCEIQDSPGDGLLVTGVQEYKLDNVKCNNGDGWGFVFKEVKNVICTGLNAEGNSLGGIRIVGPPVDAAWETERERPSIIINGVYCERTGGAPVLSVEGVDNVKAGKFYVDGGGGINIKKHPDHGRPARYNVIDATELAGDVTIDQGCFNNVIYRNRTNVNNCKIYDNDGRNTVLNTPNLGEASSWVIDHTLDGADATPVIKNSMPNPDTTGNAFTGYGDHKVLTPVGDADASFDFQQDSLPTGTYFFQVAIDADHNIDPHIAIIDTADSNNTYNWDDQTWGADASPRWDIPALKDVRLFEVPIVLTQARTMRIRVTAKNWSTGDSLRIYYGGLSTTPRAKRYRRSGNVTIGTGINAYTWQNIFSTDTATTDPGARGLKFNHSNPANVTEVYVNIEDSGGREIEEYLANMSTGSLFRVDDKSDSESYALFRVSGAITDNTGWYTIPVTAVKTGNLPNDGMELGVASDAAGGSATSYIDAANSSQVQIGRDNRLTATDGTYTVTTTSGSKDTFVAFSAVGKTNTLNGYTIDQTPVFFVESSGTFVPQGKEITDPQTIQGLLDRMGRYDGELATVSGYYASGDGTGTLTYEWDADSTLVDNGADATHPGTVVTPTANIGNPGRWIARTSGPYNAKWFGAKGDNIQDDTLYLQQACDVVFYGPALFGFEANTRKLFIPRGSYKTTDTIQTSYGGSLRHITITGDGDGAPYITTDGTWFYPTFDDRPVFVVQGARYARIRSIAYVGPDATATGFTHPEADQATWDAISPNYAEGINNPFAAIAVDPYSGAKPVSTPYPEPVIPAGLGITSWSRAATSRVLVEDCVFTRFAVAVAVKPSHGAGYDGNGDFVRVKRCAIEFCKYALTADGTQTRMNTLEECKTTYLFAAVAGGIYGDSPVSGELRLKSCEMNLVTYMMYNTKTNNAGQCLISENFGEVMGAVCYCFNGTSLTPTITIERNQIRFSGSDSTQARFHINAPQCKINLHDNRFQIALGANCTRPILSINTTAKLLNATGNNLRYPVGAVGAWQTAATELIWGLASRPDSELAAHSNTPELFAWQRGGTATQGEPISGTATFNGDGEYEGTISPSIVDYVEVGDFISLIPVSQDLVGYFFKVTAIGANITLQLINDVDSDGDPLDASGVTSAIEGATSYIKVSKQAPPGIASSLDDRLQPVDFNASTPVSVDTALGRLGKVHLSEAAELLGNINNLPVGKTFTLLVTKTNSADSLTLNTAADFTVKSTLTADTAAVAVGDPLTIRFTRTAQGSGGGEILVEY